VKQVEKKSYAKPELLVHGDLEKITLEGNQPNADLPGGDDNTAFSPGD
jgi:hypothetical protein